MVTFAREHVIVTMSMFLHAISRDAWHPPAQGTKVQPYSPKRGLGRLGSRLSAMDKKRLPRRKRCRSSGSRRSEAAPVAVATGTQAASMEDVGYDESQDEI